MSHRTRSISWIEGKILSELSKRQEIPYLSLSAMVLRNIRTIDEEHNIDIAIINLLSRRQISKSKNYGIITYKLCA